MEDMSVSLIEINAFPNLNHDALRVGATAASGSAHEMDFRNAGFDRDLMRIIGLDQQVRATRAERGK